MINFRSLFYSDITSHIELR